MKKNKSDAAMKKLLTVGEIKSLNLKMQLNEAKEKKFHRKLELIRQGSWRPIKD